MSRAAADKQEEREKSFKEGLAAGLTNKRANEAVSIRKKKREWAMSRKRGAMPVAGDFSLERMLALYKCDALVAGDERQLRLLHDILERATTAMLDAHVPKLVNDQVFAALVQHCERDDCIIALRQLTGVETRWDHEIARSVVKAGFLNAMAAEPNPKRILFWDVLGNLLLAGGKPAAKTVLGSVLFTRGIVQGVVPNLVQSDQWMPVVTTLIVELNGAGGEGETTWPLIAWSWPLVVDVLVHRVPAVAHIDLDESQRVLVNCALTVVNRVLIVNGTLDRPDLSLSLLFQERSGHTPPLALPLLCKLLDVLRNCRDTTTEVRVLEIMVRLLALPLPQTHDLHFMMHEAGCVRDMLVHGSRPDAVARYWAMLWIGNYMADGTGFVRHLLEAGAMTVLNAAMNRAEIQVKSNAIYAVMTAFKVCQNDWEEAPNPQRSARALANETLHSLVVSHKIFAHLTEQLGLEGMEDLSTNILMCLRCALEWNRTLTLESLRVYKVHARIEDMVSQMKAARSTALYEVAVEVDDLMRGRVPENREAALEAANAAAQGWRMDTTEEVFMGRFDF